MTTISPVRYFVVVPLHSPYMLLALAAAALAGMLMLAVDPSRGADAVGPLALLQMFAASSGFAVAARRGHLDLLFTGGAGRGRLAVTHLALSVLPGLGAWLAVAAVEMGLRATWAPDALASGTLAAFAVISTVAWALTVRLPRLGGGIAWLLALAVWVIAWSDSAALLADLHAPAVPPATRAIVTLVCPLVLLGRRVSGEEWLVVAPAILTALLLTAGAVWWIVRMDVPLESAQ